MNDQIANNTFDIKDNNNIEKLGNTYCYKCLAVTRSL